MYRILKGLVVLAAILFLVNGVRWLVDPAGIVGMFGFELSSGIGLSSQIGDMSGYFLTLGVCMLMGLKSSNRIWFYPPIILLSLTALGRTLAWLFHDATFAAGLIGPELIISAILLLAARRLPVSKSVLK